MLDRDSAKKLTQKVLALSSADEAHVSVSDETVAHIRFARNGPSTSGEFSNPSISVSSVFGKRTGTVRTNQFDDGSLERVVRRSEQIARLAPEDREHLAGLGPQRYESIDAAFDAPTAKAGGAGLAAGVATCIENASALNFIGAGFTESKATLSVSANTRGMFGYHAATNVYVGETVRSDDGSGSGWAASSAARMSQLDYDLVGVDAAVKARTSRGPKPLEPGSYVTILEPACVANLVTMLTGAMSARSADEGRSFFSRRGGGNRRGDKLFGDDIRIYSDPKHERVPGRPWGGGGVPQQPIDWIKNGRLENLYYDRFWAQKSEVAAIPAPSNVIMAGGEGTVDDLVASTKRGVLVTSLWYIRSLDPRSMRFTGLTRDGVFWIEGGKIVRPVKNFRWNDSPVSMLKNVVGMSKSVPMPPRPSCSNTVMVPALKVKAFNFASVSDAV